MLKVLTVTFFDWSSSLGRDSKTNRQTKRQSQSRRSKENFTLSGNPAAFTVDLKAVRSPEGALYGQMAKQFAVRSELR